MPWLNYSASQGIVDCTTEEMRDQMVRTALGRFKERNADLTPESIFCCRMLIGNATFDNPKLACFVLRLGDNGQPDSTLMLWSEAEERGIAKYLLSLINKGDGSYRPDIGRRLFPEHVPEGTPPDEVR